MGAAPHGSVVQRDVPRHDLLAFEVKDKISKPDIDWMSSIADDAMKVHDKIDMLIIMSNYEGSDLAAKFDGYAASAVTRTEDSRRR